MLVYLDFGDKVIREDKILSIFVTPGIEKSKTTYSVYSQDIRVYRVVIEDTAGTYHYINYYEKEEDAFKELERIKELIKDVASYKKVN